MENSIKFGKEIDMQMPFRLLIVFLLIVSLAPPTSAYTQKFPLEYELHVKEAVKSTIKHPHSLGVARFEDARPLVEKSRDERSKQSPEEVDYYTDDTRLGLNGIAYDLTRMLTNHLEHSGLFKEVKRLKLKSKNIYNNLNKPKLPREYDFVLIGKIKHFYGFSTIRLEDCKNPDPASTVAAVGLTAAFGAIGGGVGGAILEDQIRRKVKELLKDARINAHTQLAELKLIKTKTGKVVWEGEVEYHATKEESAEALYPISYVAAVLSLRGAVNKLVRELEQVLKK